MILTVTLNAALDVTYRVRHLSAGESVRVSGVTLRAGGKGLNVASVLAELEADIVATGFIGGHRGGLIHQQLTATRITDAFVDIEAESRQTVTAIADDGLVAAYDEPGPNVSSVEWQALLNRLPALLERCRPAFHRLRGADHDGSGSLCAGPSRHIGSVARRRRVGRARRREGQPQGAGRMGRS
jgi:tagatose 6-phosphate kinase